MEKVVSDLEEFIKEGKNITAIVTSPEEYWIAVHAPEGLRMQEALVQWGHLTDWLFDRCPNEDARNHIKAGLLKKIEALRIEKGD